MKTLAWSSPALDDMAALDKATARRLQVAIERASRALMLSDAAVIFPVTHRWDETLGLVIATNLASTLLYFIHERIWSRIQQGKTIEEVPGFPGWIHTF